jgi:hypothetical protein
VTDPKALFFAKGIVDASFFLAVTRGLHKNQGGEGRENHFASFFVCVVIFCIGSFAKRTVVVVFFLLSILPSPLSPLIPLQSSPFGAYFHTQRTPAYTPPSTTSFFFFLSSQLPLSPLPLSIIQCACCLSS